MIWKKLYSFVNRELTDRVSIGIGETLFYRDSIMIVIDKRYSQISGYEYMVLLDGEVHGWITNSILLDLKRRGVQ